MIQVLDKNLIYDPCTDTKENSENSGSIKFYKCGKWKKNH